jgi:hypothetical protein
MIIYIITTFIGILFGFGLYESRRRKRIRLARRNRANIRRRQKRLERAIGRFYMNRFSDGDDVDPDKNKERKFVGNVEVIRIGINEAIPFAVEKIQLEDPYYQNRSIPIGIQYDQGGRAILMMSDVYPIIQH